SRIHLCLNTRRSRRKRRLQWRRRWRI
uniref:Uncharacterized protein n=1 Tax=Musa acuminata subsp. malaccensis TaxID=214687 RepID=A0A804JBM8_MUSAM